jgi:lipopolysaccharide export system protein LptA
MTVPHVRFTIERIRTVVLVAGLLLVVALGVFLTIGRWRSPFNRRDLPKKLGIDIQQEANGFTHAEFHAGHAQFKITASKVEQLKNQSYRLHVVKIEMYDPAGGGTDRIEGSEFEYDQQAGTAHADGPVEITLDRPKSTQSSAGKKPATQTATSQKKSATPDPAGKAPAPDQIHVETSGLTYNQNTGVATSTQHVEFDSPEGWGSAMGASYDSQNGRLVLNSAVELNTQHSVDPVAITAEHAEIDRNADLCRLIAGTARYRHGDARAKQATIQFRDDGSAQELDATNGLVLTTASGGHLAAPTGSLQFDEHSQPKLGHLEGGVMVDSDNNGRKLHGTAPTAQLEFVSGGVLRLAHLERGVNFDSDEQTNAAGVASRAHRVWESPVADLAFRDSGKGQVELDSLHGIGGVVVTSESQRGATAPAHARMTADDVKGTFGPDSTLSTLTGVGHANIEQTTETGARQTTSGDRLEARFAGSQAADAKSHGQKANGPAGATQIDAATMVGHVVLVQQAATKPGSASGAAAPSALRATAERADYEGAGELLHLTGNPRVVNGGLDLVAGKIDISRASGDAFAHGDVKATWFGSEATANAGQDPASTARPGPGLGSQGPTHVIASEAQLHQATGEATFRGQARLWQQGNSVNAPVIVLDRTKQTLVARTANAADPVKVVLVSAANAGQTMTNGEQNNSGAGPNKSGKPDTPSVIRVRGGDLKYSDAERKAVMHGGALGSVVAETGDATTHSSEVELLLLPAGNHARKDGGSAQVDRMTALGNVIIDSQGRHGTGEKLDYSSERGEYVLTGTAAAPPRMTDQARGTVTGGSLIFNSRDDSVNVEGDGRQTSTETTMPKKP